MDMLTPLNIYLLGKLDTFITACGVAALVWLIPSFGFLLARFTEGERWTTIPAIFSISMVFMFWALAVLIPSTELAATMFAVPEVVEWSQTSETAGKAGQLLNQLLDLGLDKTEKALSQ